MSEREDNDSGGEPQMPRRQGHKGGKINRFEPLNTIELMTYPLTVSFFQHVGCFDFCERVHQVQNHPKLTSLFIINLHEKQVNLTVVNFELSIDVISNATCILSVGEKWFKQANLDMSYHEKYLKPSYKDHKKSIFPFSHLLDRCAPMMRIIMNYFTCEGRFSQILFLSH